MEREIDFLMEDLKEPFISSFAVKRERPTVLEFVTDVRKEATERYPRNINEKCQLVINGVRHSISIVFRDLNGRFVLINRKSIGENPLANENNKKEELAELRGKDFPLASRGILPDSSFKLDDKLDDTLIKSVQYIGTAREYPEELGAKDDSEDVKMPCYIADVFSDFKDLEGDDRWDLLSTSGVLDLKPEQCSSKVTVLKNFLGDKVKQFLND